MSQHCVATEKALNDKKNLSKRDRTKVLRRQTKHNQLYKKFDVEEEAERMAAKQKAADAAMASLLDEEMASASNKPATGDPTSSKKKKKKKSARAWSRTR